MIIKQIKELLATRGQEFGSDLPFQCTICTDENTGKIWIAANGNWKFLFIDVAGELPTRNPDYSDTYISNVDRKTIKTRQWHSCCDADLEGLELI